jgi:hypothetical protein
MQTMPRSHKAEVLGTLRPALLGVLCEVADIGVPEQAGSEGADVVNPPIHRPLTQYVWPGRREGVRCPDAHETPLSEAEIEFGTKRGLFADLAGLALSYPHEFGEFA